MTTEDKAAELFTWLGRRELHRAFRLAGLLLAARTEAEDAVLVTLHRDARLSGGF